MEQRLYELNGQGGRAGDKVTGRSGFTLAELMVVVALIGLIVTMAIPAYLKMQPHLRLKSAARDVTSALQIARTTSIARNMKTRVVFDKTNNTFVIELNTSGSTWERATNVSVNSDSWVDVDIYSESGGKLSGSYNLTGNYVEFRPDGTTSIADTAHTDESVFLENKNKKTEWYRVRVIANSGMPYTERWNESKSEWEPPL